jgi:hypothetical protein
MDEHVLQVLLASSITFDGMITNGRGRMQKRSNSPRNASGVIDPRFCRVRVSDPRLYQTSSDCRRLQDANGRLLD